MPGVLMLEALAQTGGLLIRLSSDEKGDIEVFFTGIDKARFRRPVRPGDQLILEGEIIGRKGDFWKMSCKGLVEGKVAVEANLMGALRERKGKE